MLLLTSEVQVRCPRAPSYLNSRLLGYVPIGYIEPSSHYFGNWSHRDAYVPYKGSKGGNVDGGHLAPPVKEQIFMAHPNQSD